MFEGVKDFITGKKRKETAKAVQKLVEIVEKQMQIDPDNDYYQQIYSQLVGLRGVPALDYKLVKFVNDGYIGNPHVYTVVNRIIQPPKSVPWNVYKITNKANFKRYKAAVELKDFAQAIEWQAKAMELVDDVKHPFVNMIENGANEMQSWQDWVEMSMGYFAITGNDFMYKYRPAGLTYATKMYSLPAQVTQVILGDWYVGNRTEMISGYQLAIGTKKIPIDADKVIHRKKFNPTFGLTNRAEDFLYGLSPMRPLCRVVQRSNESIDASLAMILNGFPPGILSPAPVSDNAMTNPLTQKEKDDIQYNYVANYGGGKNANKMVFSPMPLTFIKLGLKSADLELLQADKAALEDVARAYNVPLPVLVNDASSYNNVTTAIKELWQGAIIPEMCAFRDALNHNAVAEYNDATGQNTWIDFDLKAIPALQEDKFRKGELHLKERELGIHSEDDYRMLMDYTTMGTPDAQRKVLRTNLRFTDEPLPNNQTNNYGSTTENPTGGN